MTQAGVIAAVAIFAATYVVMAVGKGPGYHIDRAGAALLGASLMVGFGILTLDEACRAIDMETVTLLLGMMIVVANLRLSGVFRLVNGFVVSRAGHPLMLLAAIVLVTGFFSAFLVNDAICLVMTPLVLVLVEQLKRSPVPYLLAVAMASNAGSVATITGNPQNMIIGSVSHIPYGVFAGALAPVAIAALALTVEAVSAVLPSVALVVLHIEVDPAKLIADEEVALQMLREKREVPSSDRAVEVKKVFDAWLEAAGPVQEKTTWRKLVGAEEPTAIQAMRDADFIITARPRNFDGRDALHSVLFNHHLVLVMPPDWHPTTEALYRHIAVGWKPTRQVDQPMLLSLPLLRSADPVSLLAIDQPADNYSHDFVLRLIQQMGVAPELHPVRSESRSVGRTLLEEEQRLGADSLVVGACRYGQLLERSLEA